VSGENGVVFGLPNVPSNGQTNREQRRSRRLWWTHVATCHIGCNKYITAYWPETDYNIVSHKDYK
jgi:hypothetical protein